MSRRRTARLVVMVAIALVAVVVYAATGPLRGWLVQMVHGR